MTSTQLLMTLRGGTAISIIFLASRWWILPKEMGTQSSTCIFVFFRSPCLSGRCVLSCPLPCAKLSWAGSLSEVKATVTATVQVSLPYSRMKYWQAHLGSRPKAT